MANALRRWHEYRDLRDDYAWPASIMDVLAIAVGVVIGMLIWA